MNIFKKIKVTIVSVVSTIRSALERILIRKALQSFAVFRQEGIFQSIDSDSISLSFNGLNKPMVIRGVSDKTFTYLVMPMNR